MVAVGRNPIINHFAITRAALDVVRTGGAQALSMRHLARSLGVTAASLYGHVTDRSEVLALVQAEGIREFGAGFATAGPAIGDKAGFYRQWALDNPLLYPVVFQDFLERDRGAAHAEGTVLAEVLIALGTTHAEARVRWALVHGLVDLELRGRFPADADLDATWAAAIALIERD